MQGTFWVHWKQGDDLADCLKEANNDPHVALELWAKRMENNAQDIRKLSSMMAQF